MKDQYKDNKLTIAIISLVTAILSIIVAAFAICFAIPAFFGKGVQKNDRFYMSDFEPNIVLLETNTKKGSGFIFNGDGNNVDIVTNYHVVQEYIDNVKNVKIKLFHNDDYVHNAKLIGFSEFYDLAFMRVEYNKPFNHFRYDNSSSIGTKVVSIGNHYGYGLSMYDGIISNDDAKFKNISGYNVPCYQVTAPINSGASGGIVVSSNGLVGIGTAQAIINEQVDKNTNYVIPINQVNALYNNAIRYCDIIKEIPTINMYYENDICKINNSKLQCDIEKTTEGLIIKSCSDNDFIGKKIVKINGKQVKTIVELMNELDNYSNSGNGEVLKIYFDEEVFRSINGLNHY